MEGESYPGLIQGALTPGWVNAKVCKALPKAAGQSHAFNIAKIVPRYPVHFVFKLLSLFYVVCVHTSFLSSGSHRISSG